MHQKIITTVLYLLSVFWPMGCYIYVKQIKRGLAVSLTPILCMVAFFFLIDILQYIFTDVQWLWFLLPGALITIMAPMIDSLMCVNKYLQQKI